LAKLPAEKYGSWVNYLSKVMPGLIFCFILGALAKWIDANVIPAQLFVVNYVLIAIVFGLFIRNIVPNLERLDDGIDFASKICLYIGIVLMGARLNLIETFSVGGIAIIMVAISISMCIYVCGWMGKKIFSNERWGHLVGIGIGVCGISAIIALAPVIKAKQREILAAIGAALLSDVMVLLLLPTIGHLMGWGDTLAGFIAGVVPANTAQSIAIGYAYSEPAGMIATIVKSARNALLPIVILLMTFIYTRRGLPVGEKFHVRILWVRFPKFVLGLLITATIGTLGFISKEGLDLSRDLSNWFFVTCFVGIGAGIDIKSINAQDIAIIGSGVLMTLIIGLYAYYFSTLILLV
jgi:uncharacterized integral membrane protein (TIGR00698 family)